MPFSDKQRTRTSPVNSLTANCKIHGENLSYNCGRDSGIKLKPSIPESSSIKKSINSFA